VRARWCTAVCYAPRPLFDVRLPPLERRRGDAFFAATDFATRVDLWLDVERPFVVPDFFAFDV